MHILFISRPSVRESERTVQLKGFKPVSKVCSEHMNDRQYLSLGDLEQNEFFPESKS